MDVDLTNTKVALKAYDKFQAEWAARMPLSDEDFRSFLEMEGRLGEAVGATYGEDTKGFNSPQTCRQCVRPGPATPPVGQELSFVRRMVAKYGQEAA